jgi:hypothetical protein
LSKIREFSSLRDEKGIIKMSATASKRSLDPRALIGHAWAFNAPLTLAGLFMLITLGGSLIGLIVDPLIITGATAWLKPAHFAISLSMYTFTLLWLLTFIQGHRRLVAFAATATAIAASVDMGIVALQVIRGTTSHFNHSTPLNAILGSIMGNFAFLLLALALLVMILLLCQRGLDPVWAWSLRLGLFFVLAGMAVGCVMAVHKGYSVGVADGSPGLPFLGWSTVGGDLRVAHLVGLHGFQILPLVGWLLLTYAKGLNMAHRIGLLWVVGMSYLGLVLLLFWQAMRGQSVIAPDAMTLIALGLLVSITALLTIAIIGHARYQNGIATKVPPVPGGCGV